MNGFRMRKRAPFQFGADSGPSHSSNDAIGHDRHGVDVVARAADLVEDRRPLECVANELRRRPVIPVLETRQHGRHAHRRRRECGRVIGEIDEAAELLVELGAILLENLGEHVRLELVEHDVDDVPR